MGRSIASPFTEPDGRVALEFNIGGTMAKPSFCWTLAEAEQRTLQRLTDEDKAAAQAQQPLEEEAKKTAEELKKKLREKLKP